MMKQKDEEIQYQYYSDTASAYDEMHTQGKDEHYFALAYISCLLPLWGVSSVLDVGCGTGRVVKYFVEKHPETKILGVEPVQELIDQAIKKNGIPAEMLMRASGLSLPFENCSFDAVCEFGVLHHVKKPNLMVSEMIRVARKVVLLSDANRFGQDGMWPNVARLVAYKCHLWSIIDFIKTKGKGYTMSKGDGLAYSYSVFDSYCMLEEWADRIFLIPTRPANCKSWFHPLLTSSTVLLCAIKD